MLRFDWTEDDRDAYESLLNYLVRKHRCGVVDEHLHGIKDFYLVPLMVDQSVPNNLLPFDGPGRSFVHLHHALICMVCESKAS